MPAIHFVRCSFHHIGTRWVERDPNDADRETTITDLLAGQFDDPVQVIEVDIEEGTCRDVSEDIARAVAERARAAGDRLTWSVWAFVNDHVSTAFARGLEPESLTPIRSLIAAE